MLREKLSQRTKQNSFITIVYVQGNAVAPQSEAGTTTGTGMNRPLSFVLWLSVQTIARRKDAGFNS
jgi:hypothetical protein